MKVVNRMLIHPVGLVFVMDYKYTLYTMDNNLTTSTHVMHYKTL